MTASEMESAVRESFEAVGRGDRTRLRELFAPDLRWRVPLGAVEPYAGLHQGAEAVIDLMLSAVNDAFVQGSQKTVISNFVSGDDIAVVESEMHAATPAGDEYKNDYAFFFEFRDGLISEIREHVDARYAADFFGQAK